MSSNNSDGDSNTPRSDYLQSEDYFMAVAFLSSQRSKDRSTQVGACIVNSEKKIVGIGYNRMPDRCDDTKLPWSRDAENWLDRKYPYICHAEMNAIMNKNASSLKDCVIYVTLFPCNECAKLIIQAGIKEVVYTSDKYKEEKETIASRRMLDLAGIRYRPYRKTILTEPQIVIDLVSLGLLGDSLSGPEEGHSSSSS